jgi:hypothetical protein
MENIIWELIDPNLNIFAFVFLFDIVLSQPHCVQNYLVKCLFEMLTAFGTPCILNKLAPDVGGHESFEISGIVSLFGGEHRKLLTIRQSMNYDNELSDTVMYSLPSVEL